MNGLVYWETRGGKKILEAKTGAGAVETEGMEVLMTKGGKELENLLLSVQDEKKGGVKSL